MIQSHADSVQSIAAGIGYGGAVTFVGVTLADIDVLLRILVGAASFVSILVHLYFKIKAESKNND